MTTDLESAAAADESTDAAALAQIAAARPDLQVAIAQHPNVYDGLLDWIAQYGTAEGRAAVAARRAGIAVAPAATSASAVEADPSSHVLRKRRVGLIAAVIAVVVLILAAAAITAAIAKENRDSRPAVITVWVDSVSGGSLAGIAFDYAAAGDGDTGQVVTDADGWATFLVTKTGDFSVSILPDTLPTGYELVSEETQFGWAETGADQSVTFSVQRRPDAALTPTPSAEPAPADALGVATGSATWQLATTSGYAYDLRIETFASRDSGSVGGYGIGVICGDFDPATDIAVPVQLTATPTTQGFDTPISAAVLAMHVGGDYAGSGAQPMRDDGRVDVEQYFSTETECRAWSSTNMWGYGGESPAAVKWENPVSAGSSVSHVMTLIVKDFRTPNTPDGDAALLDWITLQPTFAGSADSEPGQYSVVGGADVGLSLSGSVVTE